MNVSTRHLTYAGVGLVCLAGCINQTGDAGDAPFVAAKAIAVADLIGGAGGFGGMAMTGYSDHTPLSMGFVDADDLADPDDTMSVLLTNESTQEATFHLTYFASSLGFEEQTMDVVVGAGEETTVEIPCAEIVGMGSLTMPGAMGCHLADGIEVENTLAVPVFLGMDFACGTVLQFVLTPDADDLDADDDVEELILLSDGMLGHMQSGGPTGHTHRMGGMMGGMMFGHMGG
ncbi:MAG: hypothetical protein AAB385_03670 [Planctomycetota bacterium]